MLQLIAKEIDIVKISKLLANFDIEASISSKRINLNDEIPDELINVLCDELEILSVENNCAEEPENKSEFLYKGDYKIIDKTSDYDLLYSKVKRGQIYLCDLGNAYGSEIMGVRFVVVIQNDVANHYSPTTIVIPMSTKISMCPTNLLFYLSEETVIDFNSDNFKRRNVIFKCDQIKSVDKKRLRKYLGTLSEEIMAKVEEKVKISLHLEEERT